MTRQPSSPPLGRDAHLGVPASENLSALESRFCSTTRTSAVAARTVAPAGSATVTAASRSRDQGREVGERVVDGTAEIDGLLLADRPTGAGVREQPLEHPREAAAAVGDVPRVLALVRCEPGALQQLGEAGDRPQGVREVVRRDGGEAVELLVGDPQLVERVAERQVGLPALR